MNHHSDPAWRIIEQIDLKKLSQTVEVIFLMYREGLHRVKATDRVRERRGILYPTVVDKYCRQHRLNVAKFNRLFDEPDMSELRRVLMHVNQDYHAEITQFFRFLLATPRAERQVGDLVELMAQMTPEELRAVLEEIEALRKSAKSASESHEAT